MFYAFNSISSQPALDELNDAMKLFGDTLVTYISILSCFIAVILAFLIIYANQFIMKRRKKELGVYMSLGMNKWSVSFIFVREILLIGFLALVIGLGIGFVLSQGISMLALKMFASDVSGFQLMFSWEAMTKTLISFAIIFLIVMLFNSRTIMNVKLINLLMASRKNQELKTPNNWITIPLFLLSIVCLTIGVTSLINYGTNKDNLLWILGTVGLGIALFYYTASSVMVLLTQRSKKIYFKDLNGFLFRQFGSKMQSNFLVIVVLCGLLLSSLVVLGTGFSTTTSLNKEAESSVPFDLTVLLPVHSETTPLEKTDNDDIALKENLDDYVELTLYEAAFTYEELFKQQELDIPENKNDLYKSNVTFISLSDYNKQMTLSGQDEIQLKSDQYLVNSDKNQPAIKKLIDNNTELTIDNKKLVPAENQLKKDVIFLKEANVPTIATIVVPDEVTKELNPNSYLLNGNFDSEEKESAIYNEMNNKWVEESLEGSVLYASQKMVYESYYGTFGVIAFITSYLGIILMIVTLTVLALQQLTEVQDNQERYLTLSKIGANKRMINRTLFRQIGFYFVSPLILSSILSIFFVRFVLDRLEPFFNVPINQNMFMSIGVIMLFYTIYFIATYQSAKRIIVEQKIN